MVATQYSLSFSYTLSVYGNHQSLSLAAPTGLDECYRAVAVAPTCRSTCDRVCVCVCVSVAVSMPVAVDVAMAIAVRVCFYKFVSVSVSL